MFNFPKNTSSWTNVSSCSDIRISRPAQADKRCVSYPELCGAEPDVGPCRAMFPHWYYDSTLGRCKGFNYGGCRGNKNNYVSERSCMDTCTGEQHTCSTRSDVTPVDALLSRCAFQELLSFQQVRKVVVLMTWKVNGVQPVKSQFVMGAVKLQSGCLQNTVW